VTTSPAPNELAVASAPVAAPRATMQVVAAVLGFSTISIFTRLATRDGTTLASVLFLRYLIALGPLVLVAGPLALRAVPRRRAIELTVIGGGFQSVVAWLTLSALDYIPAATLVFLFYTFPAWVTIFAAIRRTEPITGRRVAALFIALTGIALTVGFRSGGRIRPTGVALALAAAVLYAAFLPIIRRLQADVSPTTATTFVALGAGAIFLLGAAMSRTLALPLSLMTWTWITSLALLSTALPFTLFLSGLRTLGPMRTAIVATVEPFFVAILAAVVLDQPLTRGILFGGTCIASAVVLLQLNARPSRES
jgi:drug/metabolite transporter (DMT)-like permease